LFISLVIYRFTLWKTEGEMGASDGSGDEEGDGSERRTDDEQEANDEGSVTSTDEQGDLVLEGDVAYVPASQCRALYKVGTSRGAAVCVCTRRGGCKKAGHINSRRNLQIGGVGHYMITKGKNQQGIFVLKDSLMTRSEAEDHRQRMLEENREATRAESELRRRQSDSSKAGLKTTGLEDDVGPESDKPDMETQIREKDRQLEELSKMVRDLQQAPPKEGESNKPSSNSKTKTSLSAKKKSSSTSKPKENDTGKGKTADQTEAPGWMKDVLTHMEKLRKENTKLKNRLTPSDSPSNSNSSSNKDSSPSTSKDDSDESPSSSSDADDSDSSATSYYSLPSVKVRRTGGANRNKKSQWYSVTKGRSSKDIGVYDSWDEVKKRTHKVSGAKYSKHKTRKDAEAAVLICLKKNADAEKKAKKRAKKASRGRSLPRRNRNKNRRSSSSGRTTGEGDKADAGLGEDESLGKGAEGIFGLEVSDATRFLKSVAPPGLTKEARNRLGEQLADIGGLPGTSGVGSEDAHLSTVASSLEQLAASRSGSRRDLGGTTDPSFKSDRRNTLTTIKTIEDLRERIKDLQSPKIDVLGQVKSNMVAVCVAAGYSHSESETWIKQSPLLRMSRDGYDYYVNLHQHLLGVALGNRGWGAAEGELKVHAKKFKGFREIYQTRIQVMMRHYAYLREGDHSSWRSLRIQEIEIDRLTSLICLPAGAGAPTGTGTAATPPTGRAAYCGHCMTSLHPGGKSYCPFKDHNRTRAKELGRAAIVQLSAGLPAEEVPPP
jgi:hypothetical protein